MFDFYLGGGDNKNVLPIIIIALHSVALSWVELSWELINLFNFENMPNSSNALQYHIKEHKLHEYTH